MIFAFNTLIFYAILLCISAAPPEDEQNNVNMPWFADLALKKVDSSVGAISKDFQRQLARSKGGYFPDENVVREIRKVCGSHVFSRIFIAGDVDYPRQSVGYRCAALILQQCRYLPNLRGLQVHPIEGAQFVSYLQ